jgi:Meckel syndrome type 1 protein
MLDAASVSQVNFTTGSAVAAKARPAAGVDEGFEGRGRFREALESATGEEAGWRSGAATKPSESSQPDHEAQDVTQARAQSSSAESTNNSYTNPTSQAEDDAAKASSSGAEGAVSAEAAALEPAQPPSGDVQASLLATQAQPKAPTIEIPALAPHATETATDGATPAMQAPSTGAAAHADGDAAQAEARVAQQAQASAMLQESTLEQQKAVGQALQPLMAAGLTQSVGAQALAAQAPSKHQGVVSNPAPAPMTPAQEALEAGKPPEALSLLAKAFNNTEAATEMKLAMATETADASWRLASLEAPKATNTKPSAEGRAEGLSMLPQGIAPADGMALRAEAPLSSPPTRELPAPMPARQLAPVVVSLALGRGDEAVTIALDPVELGRVEVSIGQGKEAGQIRIVAERPETLALLQRDQRELDRALNQAGLGDMARSMSFSLASDQGRQQQYGAQEKGQRRASFTIGGVEGEGAMPSLPAPLRNATSLIDIAV